MPFRHLDVREIGDVTLIVFRNQEILDPYEIKELGEELNKLAEENQKKKFVLDFSSVNFFSTEVLGKLISMKRRVNTRNGAIILCSLSQHIREIFVITNLDLIFSIKDEQSEAMASF